MNVKLRAFRTKFRKAVRTGDEAAVLNAVAELEKDPDLMGEVLSGDEMNPDMPGLGEGDKHHVTINVHGGGGKTGDRRTRDDEGDPAAGGDPADGAPPWAQALMQRMDNMEQIIAMLADDGGGEGGEGGGEGDRAAWGRDRRGRGNDRRGRGRDDGGNENRPWLGTSGDEETEEEKKKREEEEARRETGDRRGTRDRATVGDSSSMRDGFQHMLSAAEILVPGIQYPTFDSAATPTSTVDAMCNFRRKTLDAAMKLDKSKGAVEMVMGAGGIPASFFDKVMTCDSITLAFNGAASLMAQQNQGRGLTAPHFGADGQRNGFGKKPISAADLNKRNHEFYAKV